MSYGVSVSVTNNARLVVLPTPMRVPFARAKRLRTHMVSYGVSVSVTLLLESNRSLIVDSPPHICRACARPCDIWLLCRACGSKLNVIMWMAVSGTNPSAARGPPMVQLHSSPTDDAWPTARLARQHVCGWCQSLDLGSGLTNSPHLASSAGSPSTDSHGQSINVPFSGLGLYQLQMRHACDEGPFLLTHRLYLHAANCPACNLLWPP